MLSDIQTKEALSLLMDLVSIPSPSGKEGKLAKYIFNWLSERGFKNIKIDRAGNVRARTTEEIPIITYCGHMDTVPGTFPVSLNNGRLFGRGASDAKGPLSAMLYSAYRLMQKRIPVEVLAVVREEMNSEGIKYALRDEPISKFTVFGEPSGVNNVVIGYRGRIEAEVEFYAQSFHASMPWIGRSALQYAIDFIDRLKVYEANFSSRNKTDSVSICVTRMSAGLANNVAPPDARLVLDIRIPAHIKKEKIIEDIRKLCRLTRAPRFRMKVNESVEAASSPNGYLMMAMRRAIFRALGSPAKMVKKTGSGDMNYAIKKGVEALTYGPGDGLTEHSSNESIELEGFFKTINVLTELPMELRHILSEKKI
jgi:LysW-gamma-L-lysine carboxypeptidase